MKIELIEYNDESTITFWVKVDESLVHPYSNIFYDYDSALLYFERLQITYTSNESKQVVLKTITL